MWKTFDTVKQILPKSDKVVSIASEFWKDFGVLVIIRSIHWVVITGFIANYIFAIID